MSVPRAYDRLFTQRLVAEVDAGSIEGGRRSAYIDCNLRCNDVCSIIIARFPRRAAEKAAGSRVEGANRVGNESFKVVGSVRLMIGSADCE
jgi:hypothetical protein